MKGKKIIGQCLFMIRQGSDLISHAGLRKDHNVAQSPLFVVESTMPKLPSKTDFLLICLLAFLSPICVATDNVWNDVERIVVIGDVHGDYDQFVALLRDAGLVNKRLRWRGGHTHLVQVGDVPDRGPDTRRVMDLLIALERDARKAGGYVHPLIGNHEAMNIQGDLRYVHPGEYAAFVDRRSKGRQTRYFERTVAHIKATKPEEEWPVFDAQWREQWESQFPLGYVEHRLAWLQEGKYGQWVRGHNAVIKINDTLFVHGGLSASMAQYSLDQINQKIQAELSSSEPLDQSALVNAPDGPLWYRGLATMAESAENAALVDGILSRFEAKRIVIAHTPTMPAILPRFDGRVLVVDVGLSAHYGGAQALLVIEKDELHAMQRGEQLDIPNDRDQTIAYLRQAAALEQDPAAIDRYLAALINPPPLTQPGPSEAEVAQ